MQGASVLVLTQAPTLTANLIIVIGCIIILITFIYIMAVAILPDTAK